MFSSKKVAIDKGLYDRLTAAAERAGYSSTDELIRHVLEKAAAESRHAGNDIDQKQAEEQLRGLGYLE